MKNNLSISLLAITLISSLATSSFAFEAEQAYSENTYQVSPEELAIIESNCHDIAISNGMENEELVAFTAECIAANSIFDTNEYVSSETEETIMEEEVYPTDVDEVQTENEDTLLDESELTIEENPS